jgi:competence protein ComEA
LAQSITLITTSAIPVEFFKEIIMLLSWIFGLLAAFSTSQMVFAGTLPIAKNESKVTTQSTTSQSVNINHADVNEPIHLKGLGKKRAAAIIEYRKKNGEFHSLNDLAKVKGFSQKRVETLVDKNKGKIAV